MSEHIFVGGCFDGYHEEMPEVQPSVRRHTIGKSGYDSSEYLAHRFVAGGVDFFIYAEQGMKVDEVMRRLISKYTP